MIYVIKSLCKRHLHFLYMYYLFFKIYIWFDNVKGRKPHQGLGTVVGKTCASG